MGDGIRRATDDSLIAGDVRAKGAAGWFGGS